MKRRNSGLFLGDLVDPNEYVEPLEITGYGRERLMELLDKMMEIRCAEEHIGKMVLDGVVRTPCHLGIGQEAVAVGVAGLLASTDRVFGTHRSHSHFLALGGNLKSLFAEVLGRKTGASLGMGGSMHLYDAEIGFHGSVPIVGATIPVSVGAALAAKMDKNASISVCFFGDGAAEEGILHESLNFAASQQVPVLFVCENNLFSSHLDIDLRQPGNRIARFADAHGVASLSVDGNDVLAVQSATEDLVKDLRTSRIPGFLEAVTYRHRGHVGPHEDVDVGVHRTMAEVVAWKRRDPIKRLADAMRTSGMIDEKGTLELAETVSSRVNAAVVAVQADPYPEDGQLLSFVYNGGPE